VFGANLKTAAGGGAKEVLGEQNRNNVLILSNLHGQRFLADFKETAKALKNLRDRVQELAGTGFSMVLLVC
jgi:hypothetical protein